MPGVPWDGAHTRSAGAGPGSASAGARITEQRAAINSAREAFIARGWVTEDEWGRLERNGQDADSETFDPPAVVTLRARGAVRAEWEADGLAISQEARGPWEEGTIPDSATAIRHDWRWILAAWIEEAGAFFGCRDGSEPHPM